MGISKDLSLAILAMDSCNRGYDAGIGDEGSGDADGLGGISSTIGGATVTAQSDIADNSIGVGAGFYAISYDVSAVAGFESGDIVISYRGTDSGNDVWNGWTTILGYPGPSDLATQFYLDVVADLQNAPGGQTGDVILTGHSLGGALAGGMQ